MDRPSKRPPLGEVLKAPIDYALRSKQGLHAGLLDARIARLEPPHESEHARRFLYGLSVPVTLLRITWRDAATRQRIVRCLRAPILCVALATAIGVVWTVNGLMHPRTAALEIASDDPGDHDDADDDDAVRVHDVGSLRIASPKDDERAKEKARARTSAIAAAAAAQVSPAPRSFSAIRTVLSVLESRAVKVLAVLGVIEWILVWIGREHHDQIAYDASVLTGVPGEALPRPPRLRLDFGWLWMKLWRAVRFVIFLGLDLPIVWLVQRIPVVGSYLAVVIGVVWAVYWASVFAIANSFLAWEPVPEGAAPWFIRVLRYVGRVPVLGIPVRLYARILTFATRRCWPACLAFERTPWEAAGLATTRAIASVPFAYLVMRPMFAPAATHAYVARREPPASEAPYR
jgi:hypothetical protein